MNFKNKTDNQLAEDFIRDLAKLNLFEELISRYEQKLLRYARSLGLDLNSSEDVLQDAFLKAYQNIRAFNPKKGSFSSWIYRITHNCSVDFFRRNKNYLFPEDEAWWDSISDNQDSLGNPDNPEGNSLARDLDSKLSLEKIIKAASKLDIKYREPLLLFYQESKTCEQISEILRIPSATARTRVKRARDSIKKELHASG